VRLIGRKAGIVSSNPQIKRVLMSVTDKTGIVDFARALVDEFGVQIISTGGTARTIAQAGVPVTPIEEVTQFPEMMDGRVKTLHPKVHGALLAKRDNPQHMAEAAEHGIEMIDMVVVNLYAFEKTVASGADFATCIENIDIGGPSMLRSAAKNFASVTVVTKPASYDAILAEMRENDGATTYETRRKLALDVFRTTNAYDGAIAAWMESTLAADGVETDAADEVVVAVRKQQDLRYGENPHQTAAFYRFADASPHSLANAEQFNGKPLSYNNLLDTDACWALVREFDDPAVIILKHQNPCGSATAENVVEAYDRAYACDPKSAYGGIIAANREIPASFVDHINENKQFVEVIIAPGFTDEALELLRKKKNLRVLRTGGADSPTGKEYRSIDGGLLIQDVDRADEDPAEFTVPTKRKPTPKEMDDLLFAWKVVKGVKSNAILVAKDRAGIGMGPGQPNRVDSAVLACDRAHEVCDRLGIAPTELVAASDAFLPFRDNIDMMHERGIVAVIQPGGSIRDQDCIDACDELGMAMVFTGHRHFRH
jgi:phosphoribosylaminoimidazolecarboxamide formyltransferase/IMP cyclohydrolase